MLKAVWRFVLLQSLSKNSKSLKCGEANHKKLPQGFAEDVQGTLQREMMSYLAIAGDVSPQGRTKNPLQMFNMMKGKEKKKGRKEPNIFHNHKWRSVVHEQHNRCDTINLRCGLIALTGLM